MSFKKVIASGEQVDNRPPEEFPKKSKFIRDARIWTVTEEIIDSSETWRRLMSDTGEEELVALPTLKRDMAAGDIKFIKKS